MSDWVESFEIRDPDGTFLTLTPTEACTMLARLDHEAEYGEPLGENLEALRTQLAEWVDPEDADV